MLAEEQAANSRYFFEYASARFGFSWDKVMQAQAFHFKGGQAAKTGTGGHLPGKKVVGKIAITRGLPEGRTRSRPARFPDWTERRRLPGVRRRGAQPHRRHPDRLQALRPAHREGHRRRARGRLRLHHHRRPRRRDRRGAAASSATTSRCRPSRRWRARGVISTAPDEGRHADHHRRPAHARRFRQGAGARRRRRRDRQFRDPGDRLPRHARLPHQQLPGRHRHPETASGCAPRRRQVGASGWRVSWKPRSS